MADKRNGGRGSLNGDVEVIQGIHDVRRGLYRTTVKRFQENQSKSWLDVCKEWRGSTQLKSADLITGSAFFPRAWQLISLFHSRRSSIRKHCDVRRNGLVASEYGILIGRFLCSYSKIELLVGYKLRTRHFPSFMCQYPRTCGPPRYLCTSMPAPHFLRSRSAGSMQAKQAENKILTSRSSPISLLS